MPPTPKGSGAGDNHGGHAAHRLGRLVRGGILRRWRGRPSPPPTTPSPANPGVRSDRPTLGRKPTDCRDRSDMALGIPIEPPSQVGPDTAVLSMRAEPPSLPAELSVTGVRRSTGGVARGSDRVWPCGLPVVTPNLTLPLKAEAPHDLGRVGRTSARSFARRRPRLKAAGR